VRQSDQIQLQSVGFTGLNTAATEVTINMVVTPGALKKPAWLNQKAFSIRSAATARYYSVGTTITQNGASYDVTVVAHRLPTAGLSDPGTSGTCPIAFVPAGALGLFIFGPDGTFVIQLVPPAPPAGQCFDYAPVKLPAACARATSTLAVLQQSDLVRVRAVERAHGSARTRLSAAYRTALKREQSARSHATATARSAACNSGPSAGNPL
jgi:hypothetical protein